MDIDPVDDWLEKEFNAKKNDPKNNEKDPNDPKIKSVLEFTIRYTHKLFIDEYKTPYAAIPMDDHIELFAIHSKRFKNWIRMLFYEKQGLTVDGQLDDLCSLLSAYAEFKNNSQPLGPWTKKSEISN